MHNPLRRLRPRLKASDTGCRLTSPRQVALKANPPFTKVQVAARGSAQQLSARSFTCRTYRFSAANALPWHCLVYFAGCPADVVEARPGQVTLRFADHDLVLPLQGDMVHHRVDTSTAQVHAAFCQYWYPIWNREGPQEETDIQHWPKFSDLLRDLPSPCRTVRLDLADVEAWVHVVRSLDVRKATGVSGWANSELRVLPRAAIADLASAITSSEDGSFPSHMMQARVCLLSKVPDPDLPSQARPITILCNLFRVWSRAVVSQVIRVWSYSLPRSIMGCLQGRSSSDLAYTISARIEASLAEGTDLSGVSVDLTKAFNFLARAPLEPLLFWLGMPPGLVKFWLRCLSKVTRCFQVRKSLSTPVGSTVRRPRGGPLFGFGHDCSLHRRRHALAHGGAAFLCRQLELVGNQARSP